MVLVVNISGLLLVCVTVMSQYQDILFHTNLNGTANAQTAADKSHKIYFSPQVKVDLLVQPDFLLPSHSVLIPEPLCPFLLECDVRFKNSCDIYSAAVYGVASHHILTDWRFNLAAFLLGNHTLASWHHTVLKSPSNTSLSSKKHWQ